MPRDNGIVMLCWMCSSRWADRIVAAQQLIVCSFERRPCSRVPAQAPSEMPSRVAPSEAVTETPHGRAQRRRERESASQRSLAREVGAHALRA